MYREESEPISGDPDATRASTGGAADHNGRLATNATAPDDPRNDFEEVPAIAYFVTSDDLNPHKHGATRVAGVAAIEIDSEGEAASERASEVAGEPAETDDIAQAKARIEDSRARLGETIGALRARLTPAALAHEAKEHIKDAAEEAVGTVADSLRHKAADAVHGAGEVLHAAAEHVTDTVAAIGHAVHRGGKGPADDPTPDRYELKTLPNKGIGATIMETIRLNPVPAALAGFGLGWLLLSMRRPQNDAALSSDINGGMPSPYDLSESADYNGGSYECGAFGYGSNFAAAPNGRLELDDEPNIMERASQIMRSTTGKISDAAGAIGDKASDIAADASDRVSDIGQRTGKWANGVKESAGQFKERASDSVHNLGVQTKETASAAADSVGTFVQEQPLAAAGIALVIGAAFAYALPATRKEHELLGSRRDQLVDQGKEAARNVAERVQHVANAALNQAQSSLSTTVDHAKSDLKQSITATRDVAQSQARNEGFAMAGAA